MGDEETPRGTLPRTEEAEGRTPASPDEWLARTWHPSVARSAERMTRFETPSGIVLEPLYGGAADGGFPGEYPFTRGLRATMYRGRLWTMRQYAGFASARETNRRFKLLLQSGQTGLSTAFDLPTQIGLDSDNPIAQAEIGQVGVAIDSLQDMETLFEIGRAHV